MNKWIKYPLYLFGILLALILGLFLYLSFIADIDPPDVSRYQPPTGTPVVSPSGSATLGKNWIRKSESGLWELYVEGDPYERGIANGLLAESLIHEQEVAFSEQISKMIPSGFYRNFLRYFIAWFNRNLPEHVPEEYKVEIYGVSQSASTEFNYIGTPYERILNYHAAHDIGHALQNLALVGCSSFGTWGSKSEDNNLIIGRNFDFYVGDRFAENKIVMFVSPDSGYQFMMVTWGGMIGVVSGMNMKGLTITLNAAKSEIPGGAATPVSILAREVLQYASNIEEAVAIVKKRKTFVAESFLIGSAIDGKAVNIEITPDAVDIFDPKGEEIVCTNHYESEKLGQLESNRLHIEESASKYRSERLKQLISANPSINPEIAAKILRDQSGMNGKFIGYGNEKAVNQLISHHSIIFQPVERIVWISTDPWQLGPFVAYRLDSVFDSQTKSLSNELHDTTLTIQADSFLLTSSYKNFVKFRKLKMEFMDGNQIDPLEVTRLNPEYYHAWVIAGDYYFDRKKFTEAEKMYQTALTKEIATKHEEQHIRERIKKINLENK